MEDTEGEGSMKAHPACKPAPILRKHIVVGFRIGDLTIIAEEQRDTAVDRHKWRVACSCGVEEVRTAHSLMQSAKRGRAACKTCRKTRAGQATWASRSVDVTGERYGKLTVTGRYPNDRRAWICKCDCGTEVTRNLNSLREAKKKGREPMCRHCAGDKAAKRRGASLSWCRKCADLPHRRAKPNCSACGKPHEPERIAFNGWDRRYVDPRSVG